MSQHFHGRVMKCFQMIRFCYMLQDSKLAIVMVDDFHNVSVHYLAYRSGRHHYHWRSLYWGNTMIQQYPSRHVFYLSSYFLILPKTVQAHWVTSSVWYTWSPVKSTTLVNLWFGGPVCNGSQENWWLWTDNEKYTNEWLPYLKDYAASFVADWPGWYYTKYLCDSLSNTTNHHASSRLIYIVKDHVKLSCLFIFVLFCFLLFCFLFLFCFSILFKFSNLFFGRRFRIT